MRTTEPHFSGRVGACMRRLGTRAGAIGVSLCLSGASATQAAAQLPELPTLRDLGLEYISGSGFFQLSFSGQLDLEGLHLGNGWEPEPAERTACESCHVGMGRNFQGGGEGMLRRYRLRVFGDLFLGDHVYARAEARTDRGRESFSGNPRFRIEQLFVDLTRASGGTGVRLGRFANPFGSYVDRHLTTDDHFVSPPLVYDYRTVLNRWRVPADAEALDGWKDSPDDLDLPGAPPIWEVPYQFGAMAFTRFGSLELKAAAMNSAPSSHPNAWRLVWSRFENPSWVFTGRWRMSPSVQIGASYDRGPWMEPPRSGAIGPPPGSPDGTPPPEWYDFDQQLIAADVQFARGATMIRAELVHDRWEVPNIAGVPTELGYGVEVQRDLAAGLFAAVRYGRIDFRPVTDVDDVGWEWQWEWDYDVARYEGSLGYRTSRNTGVLFSAYKQVQDGSTQGDTTFGALRLWWAF